MRPQCSEGIAEASRLILRTQLGCVFERNDRFPQWPSATTSTSPSAVHPAGVAPGEASSKSSHNISRGSSQECSPAAAAVEAELSDELATWMLDSADAGEGELASPVLAEGPS